MKEPAKSRYTDGEVEALLRESVSLLDPLAHKAARTMNIALLHILQRLAQLRDDHASLQRQVQPILKEMADDAEDVRQMSRRQRD